MKITLKKVAPDIYGVEIPNLFSHPQTGSPMGVAVRVVDEWTGYRVDRTSGLTPWESIDGGVQLPTMEEATELVTRYLRAAREQRTYHPSPF